MSYRGPPFVDSLTTGLRPVLLLTLLSALLFLPGITSVPPTDRDEARFMQATKQMLETGDLINIKFQDEFRTKKPVGIHWLQYASVEFGAQGDERAVWAYRLPSALAAWLTILAIFFVGQRHFSARTGLIAATLAASTLILMVEAHLAKTDAMLLLCVFMAQAALLEFYVRGTSRGPSQSPPMTAALLFWAALGLGVLIKGPVILAVVITTLVTLRLADKNLSWLGGLRPALGVPVAMAFVAPWILGLAASGNTNVLATSLTEDFLPKLIGGAEGHGAPPGAHLLLSPVTLWPAFLVILPGLVLAWRRRDEPAIRFALAWAGATWLMFELVPTKLPHYVLPAVPALALAAAGAWTDQASRLMRSTQGVWSIVAVVLGAGMIWAALTYAGALLPAVALAIGLLIVITTIAFGMVSTFTAVPVAACLTATVVFAGVLPNLKDLALSDRLAESVSRYAAGTNTRVALSRYHEPSAVFLLGTDTWLTNARNSASHIASSPNALAVIAPDQLQSVTEDTQSLGGTVVILDRVEGFNYSKGRAETLIVVRNEPAVKTP